jgi:hypothetical protein
MLPLAQNGQYLVCHASSYIAAASLPHGDSSYQAEFLMISAGACGNDSLLWRGWQSYLESSQVPPRQ